MGILAGVVRLKEFLGRLVGREIATVLIAGIWLVCPLVSNLRLIQSPTAAIGTLGLRFELPKRLSQRELRVVIPPCVSLPD